MTRECAKKVSRLAAAEGELWGKKNGWWKDAGAAKQLEAEISDLERDLGLVKGV